MLRAITQARTLVRRRSCRMYSDDSLSNLSEYIKLEGFEEEDLVFNYGTKEETPAKNEKRIVQYIVTHFAAFFKNEEVICGGGAPRDILLGKNFSDIDLYIPRPKNIENEILFSMLVGHDKIENVIELKSSNLESYAMSYPEASLYALEASYFGFNRSKRGIKIQFMFLDGVLPLEYVRHCFCCNMSKAWISSDGTISTDQAFIKGLLDKELHFSWEYSNGKPNLDYIKKISKKYPDFSFSLKTRKDIRRALVNKYMYT